MKKLCLISILALISGDVWANATETGKITRIIVEAGSSSATISIWLDGTDQLGECSGGDRWTIDVGDQLLNQKLSALLAAAHAERSITLFHLALNGCGNWNSNKVHYVLTDF